jgi:hypothetical protein
LFLKFDLETVELHHHEYASFFLLENVLMSKGCLAPFRPNLISQVLEALDIESNSCILQVGDRRGDLLFSTTSTFGSLNPGAPFFYDL